MCCVLVVGLWWASSDDPRADIAALSDPGTYTDLLDRARDFLDTAVVLPDDVDGSGPGIVVLEPRRGGTAASPQVGFEEASSRLLDAVRVERPDPSYGFAAVQDDGVSPVAWSPCRPIHYVVNADGAPAGFDAAVDAAFAELSDLTGLVFVDDGATGEDPVGGREAYLPEQYGDRWAPVLIAVAEDDEVPYLEGETAGVAYTYRVRGVSSGLWHLVTGSVFVDRDAFGLRSGTNRAPSWLGILRHELGHLVGLNHVDDPGQLMYPVTSTVRTYASGDRTGLALLGQGACAPDV